MSTKPWEKVPLGELCRPRQWPTLPKAAMVSAGYPVYGANGKIGFATSYTHEEPTILIGCRGTCGSVHITERRAYATGNAMALDDLEDSRVDREFLAEYLRHRGLRDVTTGSSQPQITQRNLSRVEVPLPSLAEQHEAAYLARRVGQLVSRREATVRDLARLSASLFEWLFGVPESGWAVEPLASVVREGTSVTYGIVQAGPEWPGGVPYIRTGDIVDGQVVVDGLRHTAPEIARKFPRSRVEAGEIVMSIRATVGTAAFVPPELDGANLTQGTARISPGTLVEASYLLGYLRSRMAQGWIRRQIKGSTFREITLRRLRELPVPLPPLDLQREYSRQQRQIEGLRGKAKLALDSAKDLQRAVRRKVFDP